MEAGVPIGAQPCPDPDDVPAEATVLRMLLGAQLRRLREAEGISPERAGYEIRASRSKISRMETGRVGFKIRDVEDLLTVYGVTDGQQRSEVIAWLACPAPRTGGPSTATSSPPGSRPTSGLSQRR
jgi:helix-turn-helix protein